MVVPYDVGVGIVAFLLLAGCSSVHSEPAPKSSGSASTCGEASVREAVQGFTDSFNKGDTGQLDELFARSRFEWYSTDPPGERFDSEARDRGSLMSYFAKRHQHHEHLILKSFRFNGNSDGLGNFQFELSRSSDDGLASASFEGKGAVDCSSSRPKLVVWSMARRR